MKDSIISSNQFLSVRSRLRQKIVKLLKQSNEALEDISLNEDTEAEGAVDYSDEIDDYEEKLKKKANKLNKAQPLMTLVLDTHFYTFQHYIDLYTLLYTSIIFKWFESERVSNLL